MTSIAESSEGRGGSWFRTTLVLIGLALGVSATPWPWSLLWVLVPAAVAVALLLSWRWGAWGVAVPVLLLGLVLGTAGPLTPWVWWIPVAALTGSWMGLREEGGGLPSGQQAWTLLPLLLLAAGFPWSLPYPDLVVRLEREVRASDPQVLDFFRQLGYQGDRLAAMQHSMEETAALQRRWLPKLLPSLIFLWMAALVMVGRGAAARVAGILRWPPLTRFHLNDWRLPDAAIWLFLAGLALLVAQLPSWEPTAWTLLVAAGIGYCLQGVAVVESLLLARGFTPSMILLTLLFVFLMATPVFVLAALCVGISDVWLDFRRLETPGGGEVS